MGHWFLKTLPALVALPLMAGATGAADVYLALETEGHGTYTVEARFWTPGDAAETWNVLTDYEHLPFFISSLRESQIQGRSADSLMLKQEAIGRALGVFHRHLHVLLRVKEKAVHEIAFEDMLHQDFASYSGAWHIEPAGGGGTWVRYQLKAKPNFFAPAVIARKSFRASAQDLLLSIQSEIVRRGNLNGTFLCCTQR